MLNIKGLVFICLIISFMLISCLQKDSSKEQKELLIYCGITMIKPITEIATIIEEQENCKIHITKGGSGNLLKSIKINKLGDLFLPGSESYIKTCKEEGLIEEAKLVGYNKAAIMVQKGNPKKISNDLKNFINKKYKVVIGNPKSGSIGRETKKILDKQGIFSAVEKNAFELTTDSKSLTAVSKWDENKDYIDVLAIDQQYAKEKKLVLGILKFSKHSEIAKKFLNLAVSNEGQEIFRKYGFYDIK